jgi:hypothetical protein
MNRTTSARQVLVPGIAFLSDEDDGDTYHTRACGLLEVLSGAFVLALVVALALGMAVVGPLLGR